MVFALSIVLLAWDNDQTQCIKLSLAKYFDEDMGIVLPVSLDELFDVTLAQLQVGVVVEERVETKEVVVKPRTADGGVNTGRGS